MAEIYFLSPGCDPTSQHPCHVSVDFSPSCLLTFALSSPSVNGISWGMKEATDHRYVSCLCRAVAHSSQRQMPVVPCPSGQGGTRPGVWSKETVLLPGVWVAAFSLFFAIFTSEKLPLLSGIPALPRETRWYGTIK